MDILLAAMAFAVLMIVFSTAVTSITETILRINATRADVLAKSTLQFLRDDPTIQNTIKGWFETLDDDLVRPVIKEFRENAAKYVSADDAEALKAKLDTFQNALTALEKALDTIQGESALDDDGKMKKRQAAYDALDDDVKSAFAQRAEALGTGLREEAREILVRNPALTDATNRLGKAVEWAKHALQGNSSKRIDTLSTYSFLQRLAMTQIGRKLAISAEEYALRGLTMGFERYVAASQEVFRKRAQSMTMLLSIISAFALNIDAGRLYDYLLNNPAVRKELIADIDRVAEENIATIDAYETVLRQQEQTAATPPTQTPETGADDGAQPTTTPDPTTETTTDTTPEPPADDATTTDTTAEETSETPATSTPPEPTQDAGGAGAVAGGSSVAGGSGEGSGSGERTASAVPEELQKAIAGVQFARTQVEQLSTIGNLPIGWDQFPNPEYQCIIPAPVRSGYNNLRTSLRKWWQGAGQTNGAEKGTIGASDFTKLDPSTLSDGKAILCTDANVPNFLRWVLNVLLAGFLIGLGGPFWYKVFTSLSHMVSVLRTFRGQPRQEAIGKSTSDQQRASQPLVKAVEEIDADTGSQLVNLFRASAGLPPKNFNEPDESNTSNPTV